MIYAGNKGAASLSLAQQMAILLAKADLALEKTDRERALLVIADIFDLLDTKARRARADTGPAASHRPTSTHDRSDQRPVGEREWGDNLTTLSRGPRRGDTTPLRSLPRR